MPFQQDVGYAEEVKHAFGKYHSTFRNEAGQGVAVIFERNGWLVAHVHFPVGVKPDDVIDIYWKELRRYASNEGFENKLDVIFSN